jgi:hypothetical protein
LDSDDIISLQPPINSNVLQMHRNWAISESGYTVDNGAQPHSGVFYFTKEQVGFTHWSVLEQLNIIGCLRKSILLGYLVGIPIRRW